VMTVSESVQAITNLLVHFVIFRRVGISFLQLYSDSTLYIIIVQCDLVLLYALHDGPRGRAGDPNTQSDRARCILHGRDV
jgi:hypothetical protein